MPEEMRWRRPGRAAGRVVVGGTAVVVFAWASNGRERFGVADVVSSTTVVVWACSRRGRCGVVVVPYIVVDGVVRKREAFGFVGIAAVLDSFAVVWREAMSRLLLLVDAILVECLGSRLLSRCVSVLARDF